MATSNRERVGRAFEVLATGLAPFVDRQMTSVHGEGWLDGFVDSGPRNAAPASLRDPAFLLKVMTEAWDSAFRSRLTRTDRNLVFELRDVRNRWAHNDAFNADDTYRALDSIERVLVAVDASEAAEVGRSKTELMRLRYETDTRKAGAAAQATTGAVAGLRPWREVIVPHDDVAQGRYGLAEFVADLHQVAAGSGGPEYADPVEFFRRTYLTEGLRRLLLEATRRLAGTDGVPVVDLQTTFGGGKTHTLIALWHLCSGTALSELPEEVQDLVRAAGVDQLPQVARAALVGTRIAPGQVSVKPDGTEVATLWGELAWQLAGKDGYALVADAHVAPSSSADVDDDDRVRLVVLPPQAAHVVKTDDSPALSAAREILEHRGNAPRLYRNMVAFLAADNRRVDDLRQGMAEALAWRSISTEADELGLGAQQAAQAATKAREAEGTVERRLAETYGWALVPTQPEPITPRSCSTRCASTAKATSPHGPPDASSTRATSTWSTPPRSCEPSCSAAHSPHSGRTLSVRLVLATPLGLKP